MKTLTTATLAAAALALAACSSHDAPTDAGANETLIVNDEGAGAEGNFALENGGVFAANGADALDANATDATDPINATEIPGNAP